MTAVTGRFLPAADGPDQLLQLLSCRWVGCSSPATGYRVCDHHFAVTLSRADAFVRTVA